jgi:hypothetical protein
MALLEVTLAPFNTRSPLPHFNKLVFTNTQNIIGMGGIEVSIEELNLIGTVL